MSDNRNWTDAQLYAVNCSEKNLLLSAGAGSGKTATLTERVCRLVCDEENGVDISRMLIVTFTRAAAEELRERVRARLEAEIEKRPDSAHLARQAVSLDSADISTISGFFLKSIKPYFSALGLPPSFGVADEATVEIMKEKIMNDVIDDFFDEGSEDFIALADALSSSRDETSMNSVALSIAGKMASKGFSPDRLSLWASALDDDSEKDYFASPHGEVAKRLTVSFANHYLNVFKALLDRLKEDDFALGKYGASAEEHIAFLTVLKSLASDAGYEAVKEHVESFKPSKLPPVKAEFKTELCEKYTALKSAFKERLGKDVSALFKYRAEDISAVQSKTASSLRELSRVIGLFSERFAAEKRRRGVVDYNDIEVFAKKIFVGADGSPTAAARELAKKYDCIFIDEYQDTNAVQDSVFSAIAESIPRFMVGDVKQSIYAFRGGEPSVFVSYRDKFPQALGAGDDAAEGHTLFMSENFRSDSTVIDFVNLVSEYMFPGTTTPFTADDRLIFSGIRPEGYLEHETEVALIEKKSRGKGEDDAEDDSADPEAEYVAERIAALLTSEVRGDGTPITERDVAILVRSARYAAPFEEALRLRGIRVSDRATEEFFEQKEILLVLCLLNSIDNPLRDIYLAGAVKSPVFGFSMDDVIEVRLALFGAPLWYCIEEYAKSGGDEELREKCDSVIAFVERFSKMAKRTDSAELILSLYNEYSLYSMTDGTPPDSPRAAAIRENLTALYEMARKYESAAFGGLYGFIAYVNEKMERSATDAAASDGESVSIITIHKSKGLEFPVCFLVKCSSRFNTRDTSDSILFDPELGPALKLRDPTGLVKFDTPIRTAVSQKMRYESICEEMRILYVAMTRAKERLIVCSAVSDAASALDDAVCKIPDGTLYSVTRISCFADVILPAAAIGIKNGAAFIKLTAAKSGTTGFTKLEREAVGFVAGETEDLTELYRERLSFEYPRRRLANIPAKVTVSKLTPSLLDGEDATPEIEFSDALRAALKTESAGKSAPPLRLSADSTAGGAERGTATHVFLQFCDFDNLSLAGFDAELERLLEKKFLTPKMASLVNKNEIEGFAASGLFAEIRRAKFAKREFRFNVLLPAYEFTKDRELAEWLKNDGTDIVVQGVVDIIFESEDGRLVLADYKTDRLTPYELSHPEEAKRMLAERHRSQLTYYKAASERIFERRVDRVTVFSLALGDTADVF